MLFHKSLLSCVAAIAVASSVSASVTPVVPRNEPTCSPGTGTLYCCSQTGSLEALGPLGIVSIIEVLLGITLVTDLACDINVADCNIASSCCQNNYVDQEGLINIGFNCFEPVL